MTPEDQQEMFEHVALYLLLKLRGERDLSILIMDDIDEFANFTDFKTTEQQPCASVNQKPRSVKRLSNAGGLKARRLDF